jgi:hypothetical protein
MMKFSPFCYFKEYFMEQLIQDIQKEIQEIKDILGGK